jgi:nucleoid-associated protein
MELLKSIIHELIKEPARDGNPAIDASIEEAEHLLDSSDDATVALVSNIHSLYGTKGNASSQGTFNEEGAFAFPVQFGSFIDSNGDDEAFRELTMYAMENLRESADGENFATGGYIVFAFYQQNNEEFFLAAMLKKKDGIRLQDLRPETIQEVDLSKLHQAIKVNLSRYLNFKEAEDQDEPLNDSYLSFISPKSNQSASGYFISAFGCTDARAAAVSTKSALEAVRRFFEDDERIEHLKTDANDRAVEFMEETLKREEKICTLDELNHLVNGLIPIDLMDELNDSFVEYANGDPFFVPDRFYTNSTEVRKAKKVQLKGLGGAWNLNFEKRVLGLTCNDDIQFSPENEGSITIRNLSTDMKEKLIQAIEERS